jgi:integrase
MARRRGNNDGSIWRERDRWRAAISLDGHRITKTFNTKEDCRTWIREMRNQVDIGLTYDNSLITLSQYMGTWLPSHAVRLRPNTLRQYQHFVNDYILPFLGYVRLKELRVEQIESLYQDMLGNVGPRSVRYAHSVLNRCLKDAVKRGVIPSNPANGAALPRMEQNEMRFLDESQVLQFLAAARESRYEVLYNLAVRTGMRKAEVLGLKWTDLDWQRGTIRIQRQLQRVQGQGLLLLPPKTKSGRRTIQLGQHSLQLLRARFEAQRLERAFQGDNWQEHGLIFTTARGSPFDQRSMDRDYKQVLKRAGVENIRFHDLRHTAASLMLNNGIPVLVVSKILGHAKTSTTLDIYGHLIPIMQEEAARVMDELTTPIPVDFGKQAEADSPVPPHSGLHEQT